MKAIKFGLLTLSLLVFSLVAKANIQCSKYSTDGQLCESWSNGVSCAQFSTNGQLCETWSNGVRCARYSTDGQLCETWSNGVKCSSFSTDGQLCEAWSNGSTCSRYSTYGQFCEAWGGNGPFGSAKRALMTISSRTPSTVVSRNRNHFYRHEGFCTHEEYAAGMSTDENLVMLTYYPYCHF
jgi:hypothetical protein